jgi:hypothetical protein
MTRDEEDQNGFVPSKHGVTPARRNRRQDTERFGALEDSALLYRIELLEKDRDEHERICDDLRLGQNTRIAQIEQISDIVKRHETELVLSREQVTSVATSVNERIDETRAQQTNFTEVVNKRIDTLQTTMSDKMEGVRQVLASKTESVERSLIVRIDGFEHVLTANMEANKSYNSRWFIGILATLLTSVILIVLTQVIHLA